MRPSLPPMLAVFARVHQSPEARASVRERATTPARRSLPPRGISTTLTDPWMYDWLAKGTEW